MPEMIPVGNTVTPPNIGQSVNTLSSLVGIQQQRQALQTGQYLQQTAQAESQQSQQKNQELQALSTFTKNAQNDPAYQNPDGSLNVQKFQQDASKVAPTYGQEYIGQMTANANESIKSRQALLSLSNDQRQTAGGYLAAFAADPNASTSSWLDTVEKIKSVSDDPGYQRGTSGLLLHAPNVGSMSDAQAAQALRQYARNAAVATSAPGAALSAPTTSDYTTPSGAIGQRQTNVLSPTPTGPIGTQVRQGIGPTETPAYKEQVEYQQQQGQQFATRQQSGIAMANQSPQALDALSRARAILDKGTWTGGGVFSLTKELKNTLAGIGFDTESATNANELVKNLARYEATRANGVGNTDAARNLVSTGSPSTIVDSQAAKNIITQSMANEMAIKGYANKVGPVGSPQEGMQKEQEFRNTPNLIEGYEYGLMRSPEEAEQFAKRYGLTKQQIAATRAQMRKQGLL